ncbi:response regulator [Pseudomonas schmalbachii]|uniref:Response regulator n=1 Tax=Pseudomonas schmalbachii TaxID=2816993 RepID=A0ABS3TSG0_9PSED|nr:response regulator [Pseudomonas schmalbachii]MBO3276293.1 response regulator [Pseudomonas schmalbachii]
MIVDSLPIMRQALRVFLENREHEVVAETDNGMDALQLDREREPELVILELAIPRLGGLDLIRRLKANHPAIKVLVYSVQDSDLYASRSLQAGADGFVSKLDELGQLAEGLSALLHGRSYFPREAMHHGTEAEVAVGDESYEVAQLSARELTVLQLLAKGMSNLQIAEQLAISHKTVSTYKMRLLQKLHVDSTVKLVDIARRNSVLAWESEEPATSHSTLSVKEQHEFGMLKGLVEGSPEPMFVRDLEGRLLMCNRHFLEYHQVSFEDIRERRLDELPWFAPDQRAGMQQRYEAAIARGESISTEVAVDVHGQPRVFHAWFMPYRDEEGKVLGMLGGMRDLTARDILLAELRNARAEAEADSRLKSQVLAGISREFQPLLNLLSSLLSQALGHLAPGSPEASSILSAGQLLGEMDGTLRQIGKLVRLDVGSSQVSAEAYHLSELTGRIVEPLREQLRDGGGDLTALLSGITLDDVWLDASHYRQLLESLVGSVSSRSPEARVELELRTALQPGGFICLNVLLRNLQEDGASPLLSGVSTDGLDAVYFQSLLRLLGAKLVPVARPGPHDAPLCVEMLLLPARLQD